MRELIFEKSPKSYEILKNFSWENYFFLYFTEIFVLDAQLLSGYTTVFLFLALQMSLSSITVQLANCGFICGSLCQLFLYFAKRKPLQNYGKCILFNLNIVYKNIWLGNRYCNFRYSANMLKIRSRGFDRPQYCLIYIWIC